MVGGRVSGGMKSRRRLSARAGVGSRPRVGARALPPGHAPLLLRVLDRAGRAEGADLPREDVKVALAPSRNQSAENFGDL